MVSRTFTKIAGRVAAAAVAALSAVVVTAPSASAADQEFIYSGQDYGYAGATFDWAGRGSVRNIDLLVSDWGCDAKPVYAYFLFYNGSLHPDTTPTRRYDHSGCDKEDYSSYNDLTWSISGDSITYMGVVVCRDAANGPCKVGGLSGRNPYA
ncbi:hypothetical protein [Lentzea flaviverrucosa]|uniref:Peptidase inhibitor family I36 n=1 Tax=Lentzea flaviverrucosa TaxID=200379 RepID=A0A1H9J8H8_9PSEU|nr:hypothetical protein [Lentzea flaviverrucosa]RDI26425.1 hypothetical protein DFR72_10766 [Lentzea flaviverrucosa]SEQ83190.1 hypothetical protein SAMN05216195_103159 [Lentzea flaviverrucosa]